MRRTSRRRRRSSRKLLTNRARKLVRNLFGVSVVQSVVVPSLAAVAGYALVRATGTALAESTLPAVGGRPQVGMAVAGAALIFGVNPLAERFSFLQGRQNALMIGTSVGLLQTLVPDAIGQVERWARSSSPTSSAPTPEPQPIGSYYTERSLGMLVDISHAGAPYKGMLGLGAMPDQSAIDDRFDQAEAISTVEPTDPIQAAIAVKADRKVRERMGDTPGDRGWAGGTFARHLFSGMSPS